MDDLKFLPFYERITLRFPGYIVGKILISILLGLTFLAAHYVSIGNNVFEDWSWFLSALISTAMLCLYYATYTLRTMLPEMNMRLGSDGDKVYMDPLKCVLSDRNFVLVGLLFGLLNCGLGYCFGPPNFEGLAVITIFSGYLLAGFVCGMAVFGIYGVSVSINAFSSKTRRSFDFTSPDRCGGTLFLGEALVVFSSVTLIVGVMISVYILKAHWTNDNVWWITSLKFFWIAFPYVMSLVAMIAPAVPINKELREYKMEQEAILQDRLTEIRKHLEGNQLDASKRRELREDYEFQTNLRENLHRMRTWPYGLSANLKYLAVFIVNLFTSIESASAWVKEYFSGLGG
jgi:ribosomal protein S15P/S13E